MKFGLFGTGWWARGVHGPALAASDAVDLIGVWGRDPGKAGALADSLGTTAYSSRSDLIADVEAVSIALAPDVQCEIAIEAATAGRHLLLEKPLALDPARGDELMRVVQRTRVASVVFVTGRFQPAAEAVLTQARNTGGWTGGRADIRVSVLAQEDAVLQASTWRVERGALWDAAPHALSPLVSVLGRVRSVVAVEDDRRATYFTLEHESGVCSQVATTLHAPAEAFAWDVELYGEAGRVRVPHDLADADRYFDRAIRRLVDRASGIDLGGDVDVPFAHHLLAVVAAAQRSIGTARVEAVR